jgi:AcrR family transcriptional regulator
VSKHALHDPTPADGKRWARRKEARPQELVSAALTLFVERGYAATRLEDVAAAAGVSKGTVYLYFANKEELFKAVVRENLLPALSEGAEMVDAFDGDTPSLLREFFFGWWELIGSAPVSGLTKLIMAESSNFPDIAQFYQAEVIERADALFARILARGVARGEFRATDVALTTTALSAPMIFLMLWKHSFGPCAQKVLVPEDYIETVVTLALYGLVRRDDLPPPFPPRPPCQEAS